MATKKGGTNATMNQAKRAKKDEFYTQLNDISNELRHYRAQFRDKVVLCNCDDPYESNFFKFFALNFNALGLKKLIATSYAGSPIAGQTLPLFDMEGLKKGGVTAHEMECRPHAIEINEVPDGNGDGAIDLSDVEVLLRHDANVTHVLEGDGVYGPGDFRSAQCVEFLQQADIVVTNPPFSLFREYVAQLIERGKQFLVIGHQNAITYAGIFPFLKEDRVWLGYGFNRNCAHFIHQHYEDTATDADHREGMIRVSGVQWFTNMDTSKRHEEIPLFRKYTPEEYPTYDNYDAIEVSKVADIPIDFDGAMGVPITFMNKYNPDQFRILGATESEGKGFSGDLWRGGTAQATVRGNKVYKRIFIQRRK